MLELALGYAGRGWFVFPCWPRSKKPMTRNGFKDATLFVDQIREWWTKSPDANIAISCGPSSLTVVDVDHGADPNRRLPDGFDATYIVRTGRRPEYGIQLYYAGESPTIHGWEKDGHSGDVKSAGGYVMAAGSVHPSGELYAVIADNAVAPVPDAVRALKPVARLAVARKAGKVLEGQGQHAAVTSVAGKLRASGFDGDAIYAALLPLNPEMCEPPLPDEDLKEIAYGVARRYPIPEAAPVVTIGGKRDEGLIPTPVDWRRHYHTFEAMNEAPPPVFLIDQFLQFESITAIAAPVGQRKSIIALNVAHSLCTREPLFGAFRANPDAVPSRVLYLCPEMGLTSFSDRTRKIGLMPYVGKTLFVRTMSPVNPSDEIQDELTLDDLQPEEVLNAVVIIDTAVRFIKGDENSSEHMRVFARSVFRLTKLKAAAVVVLFHSPKGTKEASELSLENALRGSGELGAFVTCCWATRLQDADNEYASRSYLRNVKQRDFESKPFEVVGTEGVNDCRMYKVENDGAVILKQKTGGNKTNKDGMDPVALRFLDENPDMSIRKTQAALKELHISRSVGWISQEKSNLKGTGVRVSE